MAFINKIAKEVNLKIVYYGAGLSGKTTNIEYIYKKVVPTKRGQLISLKTETERTLFYMSLLAPVTTVDEILLDADRYMVRSVEKTDVYLKVMTDRRIDN